MRYHRLHGWEIPASETTPKRSSSIAAPSSPASARSRFRRRRCRARARAEEADPTAALYPAKRNAAYTLDRDVTPEKINLNYNNFYEFSTSKHLSRRSR